MSNRGRHKKKPRLWIFDCLTLDEINTMLDGQISVGNKPDIKVFMNDPYASRMGKGFAFLEFQVRYPNAKNPCVIANKIHKYKQINHL